MHFLHYSPRMNLHAACFATGVLQSSNLLHSSLLTDAKVASPSPPIQSIHPQPKQQKLAEVSSHISQVRSCQSPAWNLIAGIRCSWTKDSAKKCKLLKGKIHSRHWKQVRLYLRMRFLHISVIQAFSEWKQDFLGAKLKEMGELCFAQNYIHNLL